MSEAETHRRASELFAEIRALPEAERSGRLVAIAEPALRAAVADLLEADARAGGFLDSTRPGRSARAARAAPGLPEVVGRYRLIRALGEGGMGAVYEAEQDVPRRRVALKLVRSALAAPEIERRLRQEAQIQSRLSHPGIAAVYDAGVIPVGGVPTPYIAMELIDGHDLLRHAADRSLGTRERVELLARVAEAVEHAHARGVVHRDLKPANVLVDAEGRPKLLDFGIARAVERRPEDGTLLTATGQVLGTIPYMSPEQFSQSGTVGRASDVYSLGVLGFELLSGRLPLDVRGLSLPEAARVVHDREPSLLSSLQPGADRELEVILAKALEKDPARRYATAGELADDLRRWLAGEPVHARPASVAYVIGKLARRHRALVAAAVVAALSLVIATAVSLREASLARASQRDAEEQGQRAEKLAYEAGIAASAASLQAGDVPAAWRRLDAVPRGLRSWEWRHLASRLDASIEHVPLPAGWQPRYLRLRDGAMDVAARRDGADCVLAWDRARRRWSEPVPLDLDSIPRPWLPTVPIAHRVSPGEGPYATADPVTGLPGPTVTPCERSSRSEIHQVSKDGAIVVQVLRDEDGERVIACNARTGARVDVGSAQALRGLTTPDGSHVVLRIWQGSHDLITLRDAATLRTRVELEATSGVMDMAVDAQTTRLVALLGSGRIMAWSLPGGELSASLPIDRVSGGARLMMAPNGTIAFATAEIVELWSADLTTRLDRLVGHREHVVDVAFSADARTLTSLAPDGLREWGVAAGDPWSLRSHGTFVYEVAFDEGGEVLYSGGWDGAVRAWSVRSGREIGALQAEGPPDVLVPQALLPAKGGAELYVALREGRVGRLSLLTGSWLAAGRAQGEPTEAWLLDGRAVIHRRPSELTQAVGVHDAATLERLRDLAPIAEPLVALDGGRLAGRSPDGGVVVLTVSGRADAVRIPSPLTDTDALAAAPDGALLAVVAGGRRLSIWDTRTARLVVQGDELPSTLLLRAAWSPDGSRLAVGTREGALRLYDAATAREIVALRPHAAYVYDLAWSPDGETLASASGDGSVRLHGTRPTRELLAAAGEEEAAETAIAARFAELASAGRLDDRDLDAAWSGAAERGAARRLRLRRALAVGQRTLAQSLGLPELPAFIHPHRRLEQARPAPASAD